MKTMALSQLKINQFGFIKDINCNDNIKRRLFDLGLIPSTKITPILTSFSGDPIAYEVRNIILAIRKQDADNISVLVK